MKNLKKFGAIFAIAAVVAGSTYAVKECLVCKYDPKRPHLHIHPPLTVAPVK